MATVRRNLSPVLQKAACLNDIPHRTCEVRPMLVQLLSLDFEAKGTLNPHTPELLDTIQVYHCIRRTHFAVEKYRRNSCCGHVQESREGLMSVVLMLLLYGSSDDVVVNHTITIAMSLRLQYLQWYL